MKTIRNVTRQPLRIPLPGGKRLHLGPGQEGQVAPSALERPALQKLVKAGQVEVVGEGAQSGGAAGGAQGSHKSSHGHPHPNLVRSKGDR